MIAAASQFKNETPEESTAKASEGACGQREVTCVASAFKAILPLAICVIFIGSTVCMAWAVHWLAIQARPPILFASVVSVSSCFGLAFGFMVFYRCERNSHREREK